MAKLVRIVKRLTPEQKEKWSAFCAAQGVTESDMLGMMIERVTSGAVENNTKGLGEAKTAQLNIRATPAVLNRISERAKSEGFTSRTAWATNVLSQALTSKPSINDDELSMIRASNRELSAIGRNLNQIARQLNIEFRDSDRLTKEAIEALSSKIDEHKSLVAALLDKSQKRWE